MRSLNEITKQEIKEVNNLLKDEYYYDEKHPLTHWSDIDYHCFGKSHAIYSGYGVVRVYNYLKSVGIDIFK